MILDNDPMLKGISTHTSLAGRDLSIQNILNVMANFYSHVPRGT